MTTIILDDPIVSVNGEPVGTVYVPLAPKVGRGFGGRTWLVTDQRGKIWLIGALPDRKPRSRRPHKRTFVKLVLFSTGWMK